ncbi:solute carrier family 22 member 16-like [Aplysia californica]|uniref:Solute carrier family 22 member 16-like n=1 Tax=Aplysia californica TaxID=6500 RepID=A0ABM0JHV5_APLCA|nr:solute carrier family 22 member 16-like [Aplysia californica]
MQTFEDLIDELGGMSKFQVLVVFCIVSCQFTIGWSMLQMSYAGMIPDFTCLQDGVNHTFSANETLNVCSVNGTSCSGYVFHGSDDTVISEWDLVCDRKWVKATITSVQMCGVLVGALLAGQMGDVFGRRSSLYFFVLMHITFNFIAAFSTSWVMFAALRFFIGIGIGAIVVVVFPYPMEFLPIKWRPLLSIIPSWTLGVALFSVSALILKNWSHLHIACGVLSIPSLLGWGFVPESIRWLATKGRLKEAEEIFVKMARLNRKTLPENTQFVLQQIMLKEREARDKGRKYSYIDIFRGWRMTKITLVVTFFWFCMALSFYGISFGVASLSGSLYLNIFLLGVLEIPVQTSTFFFNNKFGRQKTSLFFFAITCVSCLGCLLAYLFAPDGIRGPAINGLSLTAKMMVGSAWSCIQTWGSELYPTVTRNLGYGFTNTGARIGGIVAPFVIDLDNRVALSYAVMSGLFLACVFLVFALEETKGKALEDSLACNGGSADNADHSLSLKDKLEQEEDTSSGVIIYKGPTGKELNNVAKV